MITLTHNGTEVVIRNVNIRDDEHLFDQSMISRRNRNGGLITYRDSVWHDFDTLQINSKSNCSVTFLAELKAFFTASQGKLVTMHIEHTDETCNSIDKTYTGVIISPLIELVTMGRDYEMDVTDNLLAEYKFENNALDASGNGHHGTEANMSYASGYVGNAANIGASESRVITPAAAAFNAPVGTVTMWCRPNWSFNDDLTHYLWDTYGGNNIRFSMVKTPDQSTAPVIDGETLGNYRLDWFSGVWKHIAYVWGLSKMYIDGELHVTFPSKNLGDGSNDLYIGDSYTGANLAFDGLIDEVHIYNTELSLAEIQTVMRSTGAGDHTRSMYDVSFEYLIESET